MEENKAGKQPQELADFIFGYFLKGKGLLSAVVEVRLGDRPSRAWRCIHCTAHLVQEANQAAEQAASTTQTATHWQQSSRPLLQVFCLLQS